MADTHARNGNKDVESIVDVVSDSKQDRARVPIIAMPTVRGNPGPLGLLGFGMTTCKDLDAFLNVVYVILCLMSSCQAKSPCMPAVVRRSRLESSLGTAFNLPGKTKN